MNILFTCAGRRNYLINYFKNALNGNGQIFATDMDLRAPSLIDADVSIQVPAIYDPNYINVLKNIIKENNINAVISLNDLELPILAKNKSDLESLGAKIIVADDNAINISFDKWETVNFLKSIGLKSPKTYLSLNAAKLALKNGEIFFPLVVKPRWGSASIGIDFPENMEELDLAYRLQTLKLKRTILAEASKDFEDTSLLIQEKIPGKEFGMDVLNDFEGNYIGTFVREKLSMRSGETDKAISIIDERFEEIGKIIGENLKHIGNLDCDVFVYNNKLYLLELNPRFGGGYPFSHEAGVNTAAIYIEWLKGNSEISHLINYQAGIMNSKCDRLLRVN
ncbi:ATP-grasp domain-containing protein [Aequorivita sinensis]|uniref:ATP-grasp domain-containing protein n=1 Tax=Aequorivita sinensis TaxID=1382458 RepID=UPI0023006A81|nr:ATP-grasp domain-containing protein [Aequorivita sinensis]